MTAEPPETNDEPVLVSACLLGHRCRYNAVVRANRVLSAAAGVVPVCPEMLGGLPTPRPPADLEGGDGGAVLDGEARVVTGDGDDVTASFVTGARAALRVALDAGVKRAILKSRSPSCGCGEISRRDGTRRPGRGVFAELLIRHGIAVDPAEFDD